MSALLVVFTSAFLAATILPVGSEPVLLAYWSTQPDALILASVGVAGVGNTLGGMVTFAMGSGIRWVWQRRWRPADQPAKVSGRALRILNRYGPMALLMSWVPLIGDPLCFAAGTLKLRVLPCLIFMAIGKFGRYALLAILFVYWSHP